MAEQDEGFLTRWSRRKEQVKRDPEIAEAPPAEDGVPAPAEEDEAPVDQAFIDNLPDIATMKRGDDFKQFLRRGVPELLRREALRKLWRLDPVFANLDGLNNYDEDYTKLGMVKMEGLKSLFRPGRGMITREQAAAEAGETLEPEETAEAPASQPEAEAPAGEPDATEAAPAQAADAAPAEDAGEALADFDTDPEAEAEPVPLASLRPRGSGRSARARRWGAPDDD